MTDKALPMIAKTDYVLFQYIILDLPETHPEWLKLQAVSRLSLPDVPEIQLSPNDLLTYWRGIEENAATDINLLKRCAGYLAAKPPRSRPGI
jgi:hypothetical protein